MSAHHVIADVFLWLGVGLILIACLGVVVTRSAYDRLHFSSPAILGVACVALAVLVQESFSLVADKALLIALLVLFGSPFLTLATARAIRVRERGDWRLHDDEHPEQSAR
jgi:multisubunit Na+/H+ antiporter MnhG subunit